MLGFIWRFCFHSPSAIPCSAITNVTASTLRCFNLSNDSTSILKSVFLLISAIPTSNALWRKFAQIGSGGSWMILPSASLTNSSPSTFRRSSNEMRFVPTDAHFLPKRKVGSNIDFVDQYLPVLWQHAPEAAFSIPARCVRTVG